jgi:hypothetical protein
MEDTPAWRGFWLGRALPLRAAVGAELLRWDEIMSILSRKNQQDDAAKGRNGAILTASSNEPYILVSDFPPGSTHA